MKIKFALLAALALALAACESHQPVYYTKTAFWEGDVAWSAQPGANSLAGSAMFQVSGTQLQPCSNIAVRLVPDSAYTRVRFNELYGSDVAGSASGIGYNEYGPELYDWRYLAAGKKTECGPNGRFNFTGVADGTWYVVATWVDSSNPKARSFSNFKRVTLRGGQATEILLP